MIKGKIFRFLGQEGYFLGTDTTIFFLLQISPFRFFPCISLHLLRGELLFYYFQQVQLTILLTVIDRLENKSELFLNSHRYIWLSEQLFSGLQSNLF